MSQVALHIPGSYNLSMHLPVVIGTVPFRRLPGYLRQCQESASDLFNTAALPAPPPYRQTATPPPPIDGWYSYSLLQPCIKYETSNLKILGWPPGSPQNFKKWHFLILHTFLYHNSRTPFILDECGSLIGCSACFQQEACLDMSCTLPKKKLTTNWTH